MTAEQVVALAMRTEQGLIADGCSELLAACLTAPLPRTHALFSPVVAPANPAAVSVASSAQTVNTWLAGLCSHGAEESDLKSYSSKTPVELPSTYPLLAGLLGSVDPQDFPVAQLMSALPTVLGAVNLMRSTPAAHCVTFRGTCAGGMRTIITHAMGSLLQPAITHSLGGGVTLARELMDQAFVSLAMLPAACAKGPVNLPAETELTLSIGNPDKPAEGTEKMAMMMAMFSRGSESTWSVKFYGEPAHHTVVKEFSRVSFDPIDESPFPAPFVLPNPVYVQTSQSYSYGKEKPKKPAGQTDKMTLVVTPFTTPSFEQACFLTETLVKLRHESGTDKLDDLLHAAFSHFRDFLFNLHQHVPYPCNMKV